ncbi:MAG: transcriptional repressor LexA [Firmicutes bacterium]|nr:transcriptional repressor LexA [Bacillota bacterium]MBR6015233.1 transcriptional repressor LexA [Bacillota bacterium]
MSSSVLKERELRILGYMKQQIAEKGYPPTVREICADLNIKSTSTVHKDIENLERAGYLKKDPAKNRALMIVEENLPEGMRSPEGSAAGSSLGASAERVDIVDVPVVGRVSAGQPILAEQNIESTFPVPAAYVSRGKNNFMLTVHGDSMINVGIYDGDYILVEQRETAENGDIVVAMVDGFESEATVKRFYKEKGHIRLQPENDTMSPIIVEDARILGHVRGVFRYFS